MSAITARAFAPTAPSLPLLRLRLGEALSGTGRLLAGLLPQGGPLARDAAVALELKLLGRVAR
jgi:hypothetical protein